MNIYTILVCLERLYQANCSNREVDPPLIFSWWTLHLSLLGSNYSSRRNCLNKLESELYQDLYIYIKLNIVNNKLVVLEENWFFLKYSLFKVWIQVSEKKKCEKFILKCYQQQPRLISSTNAHLKLQIRWAKKHLKG